MIANDTQYKITRRAAEELRAALENRDVGEIKDVHPLLVEAHWAGMADELASLEAQISDYENLKAGEEPPFLASSLEEIPDLLVRVRIARGLTQRALAELLEIKPQQVQRYESERYRSASFERILSVARVLGISLGNETNIEASAPEDIPTELFPTAEMARRGWFEDFSGTPLQAKKQAASLLPVFFKNAGMYGNQLALHRKSLRKGGEPDYVGLLAWEAHVRSIALGRHWLRPFTLSEFTDEWVRKLVQLSVHPDGPLRAVNTIHSLGVCVVYEPPLRGTRLDGAAMQLYTGRPVIGLTLRHDRIDNFWFTLLHELGHVKLHLREVARSTIFDDLEEDPGSIVENEADLFAQEALISSDDWRRCLSRFSRTQKAVFRDAEVLGVHPAIVAGRVRRESGNYMIFSDIVGTGEVRHLFDQWNNRDEIY
jgi:HTH-type transcriptional regulator/antitoxin HigA